ncbi:hypothetical protein BKP56_11135 [Marinilactibacillus sp. 15R]|uniref:DUF3284 domain-containing protein n=1 Tax=Marinilactibacillus sp. 15R TaxID=1911586 RepID=UPI00090A657F|nr:DUF3284 domain-containing protein [Marinilactibacillus sp. 15R]API89779.1 hypothetical protein BKP56_11135 [Marinilactibacillus sp. 15R]
MEIYREMNISAEQLFTTITRSVLYDIKTQTGESPSTEQMIGFEYIKTFSKNSRANIKIEEFRINEAYHYRTQTNKNDFLVKYDILPLSKDKCKIHYTEEVESIGQMQKLNDALVGTLLNYFRKKRLMQMLQSIEQT